jgi:class 3 adenylate cyclase
MLATVLFTDIVASTERAASAGDRAWRETLEHHHGDITRLLGHFRGRMVKSTGDGVLALFDGPSRAVRCAQAIVERASSTGLSIRAGLHAGEVELVGDDVAGIAVHVAQRVESEAAPHEVLVSQTLRDLLAGSDISLRDRGEHTLKGLTEPWRLYAVAHA